MDNTHHIPNHIAIVMDGNGRWAQSRHLPRTAGHKKGMDAARIVTKAAGKQGVQWLTLFGFSTENWSRPDSEIADLMGFLRTYLRSESADLHRNNVRLRVIGFRHRLDDDIVQMIEQTESLTSSNTGLNLTIALDYGGRQDIVEAARHLIASGIPVDEVNETHFASGLMSSVLPNPDLVIRTSGEMRVSNFLLWDCAYAEFYFTETLWPDFDAEGLKQAIESYGARERRYGGIAKAVMP